ncbi:GIY-YIG nuclease family protein [Roseibium aggregatum]|uniref:GIY-YIG nuclease family protein n=1 Tax=Roseibium aggregatum TaxID=187304 RepID=A0A926P544_9HYPH|nr:GIY-YIG nuclease family protein [Roseibium aggregatum]MBD1547946.1 GIY-YIG nuclease family protein [Roseibium aggregatum]
MRPVPAEAAEIARRLGASLSAGEGETERLPSGPGTYGLLLRLAEPVALDLARLGHPVLAPGLYLYCGSAKGPGGVRARLGRHLRRDKAVRWHVDYLSGVAVEAAGFMVPEATECGLRTKASDVLNATVPVPGFGSSDCRTCPAHLLLLAP